MSELHQLEYNLAYHGAPALAGIKAADLIAWGTPEQCRGEGFCRYQQELARRGICLTVLRAEGPRCLLLVYRREQLARRLEEPAVRAMLARAGYPVDGTPEEQLELLAQRLAGGEFPHEVGLFLGYPPEDVAAFCRHRGRDFKVCGCWKVYCDVEGALRGFRRYRRCREALCRRLEEGKALTQLFRAA